MNNPSVAVFDQDAFYPFSALVEGRSSRSRIFLNWRGFLGRSSCTTRCEWCSNRRPILNIMKMTKKIRPKVIAVPYRHRPRYFGIQGSSRLSDIP